MPDVANPAAVSSTKLADYLDISQTRVLQLVDEGILPATKKGRVYRFDLRESLHAYIAYLRSKSKDKEGKGDLQQQRLQADVDYKRAKADQSELELQELRGNLHRSDDVEEVLSELVYSVRSMLIALPGRLAMDVAKCSSANEASQVIKRETNRIMNELAGFEYNPKKFAALVRERQGWSEPT